VFWPTFAQDDQQKERNAGVVSTAPEISVGADLLYQGMTSVVPRMALCRGVNSVVPYKVLYQGMTSVVPYKVLYQGTTSVVPHKPHEQRGFSP
jgi:hypothetical protein